MFGKRTGGSAGAQPAASRLAPAGAASEPSKPPPPRFRPFKPNGDRTQREENRGEIPFCRGTA
jgi:hypothetical protein